MSTSLRTSISAMSSLDRLTPKTYPLIESNSQSLGVMQPKLYRFKIRNNRSQPWVWDPHPHTMILAYSHILTVVYRSLIG